MLRVAVYVGSLPFERVREVIEFQDLIATYGLEDQVNLEDPSGALHRRGSDAHRR